MIPNITRVWTSVLNPKLPRRQAPPRTLLNTLSGLTCPTVMLQVRTRGAPCWMALRLTSCRRGKMPAMNVPQPCLQLPSCPDLGSRRRLLHQAHFRACIIRLLCPCRKVLQVGDACAPLHFLPSQLVLVAECTALCLLLRLQCLLNPHQVAQVGLW